MEMALFVVSVVGSSVGLTCCCGAKAEVGVGLGLGLHLGEELEASVERGVAILHLHQYHIT
jgi:hypothetical protein